MTRFDLDTDAGRTSALLVALGVLAELQGAHPEKIQGFDFSVAAWEERPRLWIRTMDPSDHDAIFPAEAHRQGAWYGESGKQRNLERVIRGVAVTSIQTYADHLETQLGRGGR